MPTTVEGSFAAVRMVYLLHQHPKAEWRDLMLPVPAQNVGMLAEGGNFPVGLGGCWVIGGKALRCRTEGVANNWLAKW